MPRKRLKKATQAVGYGALTGVTAAGTSVGGVFVGAVGLSLIPLPPLAAITLGLAFAVVLSGSEKTGFFKEKARHKWARAKGNDNHYDHTIRGGTEAHDAVEPGNFYELEHIRAKNPKILEQRDNAGLTIAHYAAFYNRLDVLEWIADYVPKLLKAKDDFGLTAAQYALFSGNPELFNKALMHSKTPDSIRVRRYCSTPKQPSSRKGNSARAVNTLLAALESNSTLLKVRLPGRVDDKSRAQINDKLNLNLISRRFLTFIEGRYQIGCNINHLNSDHLRAIFAKYLPEETSPKYVNRAFDELMGESMARRIIAWIDKHSLSTGGEARSLLSRFKKKTQQRGMTLENLREEFINFYNENVRGKDFPSEYGPGFFNSKRPPVSIQQLCNQISNLLGLYLSGQVIFLEQEKEVKLISLERSEPEQIILIEHEEEVISIPLEHSESEEVILIEDDEEEIISIPLRCM